MTTTKSNNNGIGIDLNDRTADALAAFPKTIKQNSTKKIGDPVAIRKQLEGVRTKTPSAFEDGAIKAFLKARAEASTALLDQLVTAELSRRYPLLDPALFKLSRHLYFDRGDRLIADHTKASRVYQNEDGVRRVEVSLFVCVPVGQATQRLGGYNYTHYPKNWAEEGRGSVKRNIEVSVAVPKPPPAVAAAGQAALGAWHTMLGGLYADPLTRDLNLPVADPTLETAWIPTVRSLDVKVHETRLPPPPKPVPVDPALLLVVGRQHYVVALWDITDEDPYAHILREFSGGEAAFPKKGQ